MSETRQAILGVLAAIISAAIILGQPGGLSGGRRRQVCHRTHPDEHQRRYTHPATG